MSVKLLTEHHLEFLSLMGDCTGSFQSTLVIMPHCWKSHIMAHILFNAMFTYELFTVTEKAYKLIRTQIGRPRVSDSITIIIYINRCVCTQLVRPSPTRVLAQEVKIKVLHDHQCRQAIVRIRKYAGHCIIKIAEFILYRCISHVISCH